MNMILSLIVIVGLLLVAAPIGAQEITWCAGTYEADKGTNFGRCKVVTTDEFPQSPGGGADGGGAAGASGGDAGGTSGGTSGGDSGGCK